MKSKAGRRSMRRRSMRRSMRSMRRRRSMCPHLHSDAANTPASCPAVLFTPQSENLETGGIFCVFGLLVGLSRDRRQASRAVLGCCPTELAGAAVSRNSSRQPVAAVSRNSSSRQPAAAATRAAAATTRAAAAAATTRAAAAISGLWLQILIAV
jgi:hypothetical protein